MNTVKTKTAKELFPQLQDKSNERRFIEFIKVDDLRLFCEKCMEKANKEPSCLNNEVAENVLDLMIRKELLTLDNHQTYVDALLIAAQLFDCFYTGDDQYHNLFKARIEFDEIADLDIYEYGPIPEQMREMVWDTIEGQLGDCTPMAKTKPSPNTPQDLFAMAIYMARRFLTKLVEDGFLVATDELDFEKLIAETEEYLERLKIEQKEFETK